MFFRGVAPQRPGIDRAFQCSSLLPHPAGIGDPFLPPFRVLQHSGAFSARGTRSQPVKQRPPQYEATRRRRCAAAATAEFARAQGDDAPEPAFEMAELGIADAQRALSDVGGGILGEHLARLLDADMAEQHFSGMPTLVPNR